MTFISLTLHNSVIRTVYLDAERSQRGTKLDRFATLKKSSLQERKVNIIMNKEKDELGGANRGGLLTKLPEEGQIPRWVTSESKEQVEFS